SGSGRARRRQTRWTGETACTVERQSRNQKESPADAGEGQTEVCHTKRRHECLRHTEWNTGEP
ncbi:MAG: hypothetical protein ACRD8O_20265, partial [Bryobacteraceae bacterium]